MNGVNPFQSTCFKFVHILPLIRNVSIDGPIIVKILAWCTLARNDGRHGTKVLKFPAFVDHLDLAAFVSHRAKSISYLRKLEKVWARIFRKAFCSI